MKYILLSCVLKFFTLFYLAPQEDQVDASFHVVYVGVAIDKAFIVAFEVKIVITKRKTKPWDPKIPVRTDINSTIYVYVTECIIHCTYQN